MPSSRHAEMMRRAISPRLAIRIFLNIRRRETLNVKRKTEPEDLVSQAVPSSSLYVLRFTTLLRRESYSEELLSVFDRLPAAGIDLDDLPLHVRFDLVHELHGLDDAEDLSPGDLLPHLGEGVGFGRRSAIEGPDDRRSDDVEAFLLLFLRGKDTSSGRGARRRKGRGGGQRSGGRGGAVFGLRVRPLHGDPA